MNLDKYYEKYGSRISQPSERLFVDEFLYPLLGDNISEVEPQRRFIDSTGRSRRIDFAVPGKPPLALEVNGETYHAEGIIPNELFDDNLFRQNEILQQGYKLVRFSYNQLQAKEWRPVVNAALRNLFEDFAPHLLAGSGRIEPNPIQQEALSALQYARDHRGWDCGVVVMPTGTGKTILSAIDAQRVGGRTLFVVHRLDILRQSIDAFKKVTPNLNHGILTGVKRDGVDTCDVLFASKDSLRAPETLAGFDRQAFDYVIVDEVHHGQSPSYKAVLDHFKPRFMLGMTATPDRTDRKDIFELFQYNNAFEVSLSEVIERGYLVPYTYYGLTDDIDYSSIRFQNNRYRVDDLERLLVIPKRNDAILRAYLDSDLGGGDKAIGFCASIEHAKRMAEHFREAGLRTAAIHSQAPDRYEAIEQFRQNQLDIVFTVDIFNEGVDFPNVQVLLFLRPTESKTVFLQQLGRGLRLCPGKDRVRILDFIGNYRRANQIRKYLSKSSGRDDSRDENGRRVKKMLYEYAHGCEVHFAEEVEELLDRQDAQSFDIDKEDLREAYFAVAEALGRKPTKADLDEHGEHASRLYVQAWGNWRSFLQDVGEYTEASYHYPQGTHLGHVLSIVWHLGGRREGTHLDHKFVRMRGGLDQGRAGLYQRQLKYKLQAAMELGLVVDDRSLPPEHDGQPELTPRGLRFRNALAAKLESADLAFPFGDDGVPSTRMADSEDTYNALILEALSDSDAAEVIYETFLSMPAVVQMARYLFQVERKREIGKSSIYEGFFGAPFVERFCEQEGIEQATLEASKRRCPFLLNVLAALGVLTKSRSDVTIQRLLVFPELVRQYPSESDAELRQRVIRLRDCWPADADAMEDEELGVLREQFGAALMTSDYWIEESTFLD